MIFQAAYLEMYKKSSPVYLDCFMVYLLKRGITPA